MMMAVLAVGCGGDGDTNEESLAGAEGESVTVTTSSLSEEEFLKKANSACREERAGLVGEVAAFLREESQKGAQGGALVAKVGKQKLVPTVEAEIEAVQKLGAPRGDEEQVEAMLTAQQAAIEEVKSLESAETLYDVERHFLAAGRELADYGLFACATGVR